MNSVRGLSRLDLLVPSFVYRGISTSPINAKTKAGKFTVTKHQTKPLTYEQAFKPQMIGVRKSWLSWHTQDLYAFRQRLPKTFAEDTIIRKFMAGTWHSLFVSELVIKRRGNLIILTGIIEQRYTASRIYWLIGYTEELLGYILKQPVKLEIQSVPDRKDMTFIYV